MTQWEYKVIKVSEAEIDALPGRRFDMEEEFNRLGAEGWECVSCESITFGGVFHFTAVLVYTFKRAKAPAGQEGA